MEDPLGWPEVSTRTAAIGHRMVLAERGRAEACRRVGKDAHAGAAVARDLGVGWATSCERREDRRFTPSL